MSLPNQDLEQPVCCYCGELLDGGNVCADCADDVGPDPDLAWELERDRQDDLAREERRLSREESP